MTFRTHIPTHHPSSHVPATCRRCGERVLFEATPCPGWRCVACLRLPAEAVGSPCHMCDLPRNLRTGETA